MEVNSLLLLISEGGGIRVIRAVRDTTDLEL